MKYLSLIIIISLLSCSKTKDTSKIDFESLAYINGHHFDDINEHTHTRSPASKGKLDDPRCLDQSEKEIENLDNFILKFGGKVQDASLYEHSLAGFEQFLEDSGVDKYFSAKEMLRPNNSKAAYDCGKDLLLPPHCRWKNAIAQSLMAIKLRELVDEPIKLRNWWRPQCYNNKVSGAPTSDHINARGFDLDFKSPESRAKAQDYLCSFYKENKPYSLQIGIGCRTLHIGIGSTKRLSRYDSDGSRFWPYKSIFSCQVKRLKSDDCWKKLKGKNQLRIHTDQSSYGIL